MHKVRLLMIAMALAAVLYVKLYVNLNDIAGVAVDGPGASTAETGASAGETTTSAQ